MTGPLVECVPNFSEGRNPERVDVLVKAIIAVGGVKLLDVHSDPDHNRSVVTFAGAPEAALEAAVIGAGLAAELIDLRRHRGAHPRIGACDVLPFVPLSGTSLEECAALAVRAGEEIWRRFRVPAYLYEAAARRADRRDLAAIRQGQYERLRELVRTDPLRRPDIGGPELHPTAGAVAVGARPILIAFNVELSGGDLGVARAVAARIRSAAGGLVGVKAMGVWLASCGRAQVSMNLTDWERTPPGRALEAVAVEAARLGAGIARAEVVGLAPRAALESLASSAFPVAGAGNVLEERVAAAFADP